MYGDEEKANDAEKTKGEARKPYPFCSAMCVQNMRAFYQHRMHRGQHMCFLSLDGFSSTLAVPRLCAYLFKPFLRVLPRSEN